MHDIVVFENLRFRPFTRQREASVFEKNAFFGDSFHRIRVDGRRNRRKRQKQLRVDGS